MEAFPYSRAKNSKDVILSRKNNYRELCLSESTIPIFSRNWWLDAVVGSDNWDVALVENGGTIVASMPYVVSKRYGFTRLVMPPLTQTLGPWIRKGAGKYSKQLARQKDLMGLLVDQLPKYHSFDQNWHHTQTNWLPFYWRGFSQTTRYTYIIPSLSDLDLVYSEFEHSKRKNIKKAREAVEVRFDLPRRDFYENHKMTLQSQSQSISYSYELFSRIYSACYDHNSGRTIAAFDKSGNLHAALFVIWDENCAYDLISTIDPKYRTTGAASLLVSEVLRYLSTRTKSFDFEGSMIEAVERSFRQFGAKQTLYHSISHTPNSLLATLQGVRRWHQRTRLAPPKK